MPDIAELKQEVAADDPGEESTDEDGAAKSLETPIERISESDDHDHGIDVSLVVLEPFVRSIPLTIYVSARPYPSTRIIAYSAWKTIV